MFVRRSDRQTLAAKGGQSGILMRFGVKKQKSTLAAYGIANIFAHKKNTVQIALLCTALKK